MKQYFLEKLFDVNYKMSIHEGNASRRLASQAIKIYLLSPSEVPPLYRKEFLKLKDIIENTIRNLPAPGLTPTKLRGIGNITAAKYIKLLIDIEYNLRDE